MFWEDPVFEGIQWKTFANGQNTLNREAAIDIGLSEGDEVFIIGFPIGWRDGRRDYPIVRHAVLAQIQGWLHNEHKTFLVDGSVFKGNSGGPVITKAQSLAVEGTSSNSRALLVGMVKAYRPYITNENADLGVITPMDAIDETIQIAIQ